MPGVLCTGGHSKVLSPRVKPRMYTGVSVCRVSPSPFRLSIYGVLATFRRLKCTLAVVFVSRVLHRKAILRVASRRADKTGEEFRLRDENQTLNGILQLCDRNVKSELVSGLEAPPLSSVNSSKRPEKFESFSA